MSSYFFPKTGLQCCRMSILFIFAFWITNICYDENV